MQQLDILQRFWNCLPFAHRQLVALEPSLNPTLTDAATVLLLAVVVVVGDLDVDLAVEGDEEEDLVAAAVALDAAPLIGITRTTNGLLCRLKRRIPYATFAATSVLTAKSPPQVASLLLQTYHHHPPMSQQFHPACLHHWMFTLVTNLAVTVITMSLDG